MSSDNTDNLNIKKIETNLLAINYDEKSVFCSILIKKKIYSNLNAYGWLSGPWTLRHASRNFH